MSGDMLGAPATDLGDLFRLECETHATSLLDGLLELERMPSDMGLYDRLLRATHSLKGAARVAGLRAVVDLAHALEDGLSRAKHQAQCLTPDVIQGLMEVSDAFLRLGDDRLAPQTAELAALAVRVRALVPSAGEAQAEPSPGALRASAPEPPLPTSPPGPLREGDTDRVLRVRASHISQIASLAGEALVESRGLGPLMQAQYRLRIRQTSLVDLINELHQALGAPAVDDPIGARIAEIRSRVAECRALLGTWEEQFQQHARRAEELTMRLHREAVRSRMRPLAECLSSLPRLVRDLSRALGKQVDLTITGADVPIDRDIHEKIEAPLNHILRNAIDHGIESPEERTRAAKPPRGSIRIDARHHGGTLRLSISDDGRGIDPDRLRERIVRRRLLSGAEAAQLEEARLYDYLFLPGFSTADAVTELSGRGVGMDVVQNVMHEIGGSVLVTSEKGRGTSLELALPISRSVIRAVIVRIAGAPYAFALSRLDRLLEVSRSEVRLIDDRQYVVVDEQNVALVPTAQVLELPQPLASDERVHMLVVSTRTHRFGFVVDGFIGEQDLVVRPLDPRLGRVSDISAAAILADGSPVLIADVDDLIRSVMRLGEAARIDKLAPVATARPPRHKRVLIVDDSVSVRELERELLVQQGYDVVVAVDGVSGWAKVRDEQLDLVIVDIDMPRVDGLELTRSIKQDARLRKLPVFVISYRDSDDDRAQAVQAGADEYLSKANFQNRAFLDAVRRLIGAPVDMTPDAPEDAGGS